MKKLRPLFLLITFILASCLNITSCGAFRNEKLSKAENELVSYNRTISGFHTGYIETELCENDYEIEWCDRGLEAWLHLLLNKDGAIYHSDVCNIQVLYLVYGGSTPYGILFDELPTDADAFTPGNTVDDPNNYIYAENKIELGIHALADLLHFDHLQVFGYINLFNEKDSIDISGLAECSDLSVLYLANLDLENASDLASINSLQNVYLDNTGSLDLSVFEKMRNLAVLSLCDIEPLTNELRINQQQLQYLKLSCLDTFPAINMLEESAVKYLDFSVDRSDQPLCDSAALECLTKMKNLSYLSVNGQSNFNSNLLEAILKANTDLSVLSIKNTPAATAKLNYEFDIIVK